MTGRDVAPWRDDLVIVPAATASRVAAVLVSVSGWLNTLDPATASVLAGEVLTAHARLMTAIWAAEHQRRFPLTGACPGCCIHSGSPQP